MPDYNAIAADNLNGLDHIAGAEHKATYKPVTSCRFLFV